MKRIIFAICTILCANVLLAQEQLATLKHNDSISVYYGQNAFVEAYNAAANGDIITLSDGIFNAPSRVQKGITVRGNGAFADTARHSTGTRFRDSFDLLNLGDSLHFEAEGIYFGTFEAPGSYDVVITRCYVSSIYDIDGLQARNCIIRSGGNGSTQTSGSDSRYNTYINCILTGPGIPYTLPENVICNNSIIIGNGESSYMDYQYNNCIVIKDGTTTDTILSSAVRNSVLIGYTGASSINSSGNVAMSLSDVFENWDGETLSTDLETYVLKSSVSNSILGLDGREVGIFGGAIPFDWTPTYSVIKRLDVPNTPDENGMLNIDVEFLTE